MVRIRYANILILLLAAHTAAAQVDRPLIQLNPFSIDGIGPEESGLIISVVQSYLSDIGCLIGDSNASYSESGISAFHSSLYSAGQRPRADYTISGTIRMEREGPVFMLDITNTKTGSSHSVSSVYKNSGEMALKARSVLETAFPGIDTGNKAKLQAEELTDQMVAGMWKGEAGIEMVRLMQGGRGLAIFSSGVQMVLSYAIQGNTLKIWQISPNSERYYHPMPIEAAKQLAGSAEPMYWELLLYQGGSVLSGLRVATAARIVNGTVAGIRHGGDVREVTWTKFGP